MSLLRKILFVILPVMALVVAPVSIASDKKEDKHHGEKHHGHKKEHGFHGGPPPWAPAYGYRRGHKHDDDDDHHHYAKAPVNIQTGNCNRELIGQILGGATGGYVGSQIGDGTGRLIAVAAGTVVGIVIGGEIGRSMDREDKLCVDQTLETAPDGTKVRWNDVDRHYTVTPQSTYQNADGQYCREYQMETEVDGSTEQMYGKACRQPDGAWKIVS